MEKSPRPEARQRDPGLGRRPMLILLCLLSSVLLLVSFAPFDWSWLAYVALVPWLLAVVAARPKRGALLWAYLAGVVFWAAGLYWLTWITLLGYVLLVGYLGLYWLAAAAIVRRAFRRGVALWLVLPVVWVALEYARAYALSGFTWFYLAHSQYRWVRLIQIADVTGSYGVSFFVAMVNGAAADVLFRLLLVRARPSRWALAGVGACAAAAVGLVVYGTWRLGQQTTRPGPVIGVVQQAFRISLDDQEDDSQQMFDAHLTATQRLAGSGCDLVVWPESMLGYGNMDPGVLSLDPAKETDPDRREALELYQQNLRRLGRGLDQVGCPILAGGGMPAWQAAERSVRCNSALLFDRDARNRLVLRGRYDKMQLVPFSECVPFRRGWRALHEWLRTFVPTVMAQLEPGEEPVWFPVGTGAGTYQIAVPICYEGTFARVCRQLVMDRGRKRADVLVNISNDGWFVWQWRGRTHASTELDQHLVQYVFRAVETRVPVVRAVNTGISAHVDSNGVVRAVVSHLGRRRMVAGNLLARTVVDGRVSVYSRMGDAFVQVVAVAAGAVAILACWPRRPATDDKARKGRHGKR